MPKAPFLFLLHEKAHQRRAFFAALLHNESLNRHQQLALLAYLIAAAALGSIKCQVRAMEQVFGDQVAGAVAGDADAHRHGAPIPCRARSVPTLHQGVQAVDNQKTDNGNQHQKEQMEAQHEQGPFGNLNAVDPTDRQRHSQHVDEPTEERHSEDGDREHQSTGDRSPEDQNKSALATRRPPALLLVHVNQRV